MQFRPAAASKPEPRGTRVLAIVAVMPARPAAGSTGTRLMVGSPNRRATSTLAGES